VRASLANLDEGGEMGVNGSTVAALGVPALLLVALTACTPGEPAQNQGANAIAAQEPPLGLDELARQLDRIDGAAAGVDSIFQPLPLLSPGEEETLRRFGNATQLARARELGVGRELSEEELAALRSEGRLVELEDSEYWVLRDLDYSAPFAIPAVAELLAEVGRRFQSRLADLGAPPFRLEVTSVLRSAANQADLRRVNPNAAAGESTHEYGTTVDVLYSAYSAPLEPFVSLAGVQEELTPFLTRYAAISAERVAARRALELKAILGAVLIELQEEGRVMVTLERQQPVFHMTVSGQ
jgi:hypothetical protein